MIRTAWAALACLVIAQALAGIVPRPAAPELTAMTLVIVAWFGGFRPLLILLPLAGFLATAPPDEALPESLQGAAIVVRGEVCDIPRGDRRARRFRFEPVGRAPVRRLYVSWYDPPELPRPGETWQLKLRLRRPRGFSNPGGFDFERWARDAGIAGTARVLDSRLNRRVTAGPERCRLPRLRAHIARRIETVLDGHRATAYIVGLAVGIRDLLTRRDWNVLRRTGTSHLMAISGLHIGLVAGMCLLAGRWLMRAMVRIAGGTGPRQSIQAVALLAAAGYSALAGFGLPTLRALVMLGMLLATIALSRRVSRWEVFALALYAVLLIDQAGVHTAGFWLSFGAVGLLLLDTLAGAPQARNTGRLAVARHAGRVLRTQLRLAVALAPAGIFLFHQFTALGLIANLVAVPAFALCIVPLTLLGAALLMAWPCGDGPGAMLLTLAAEFAAAVVASLAWLSDNFDLVWMPPAAEPAWIAVAGLAGLCLVWPRPMLLRVPALALLLPAVFGTQSALPDRSDFRVVVMDVGHGLAVLVRTRRHALLYDTGPAFRRGDAGQSVVLPVLRRAGVTNLDVVVVSHRDSDHRGGLRSVLGAYPNAALIAGRAARASGGRTWRCAAGARWKWDGVEFEILHPVVPTQRPWSDNDGSCVLLVRSRNGRVLLPGDIERRAEAELVRRGVLVPVDLVVAPHHGSASSSSPPLINALHPRYVVFSAPVENRWNWPRPRVRKRWAAAGACLLTTGETGALTFAARHDSGLRLLRLHRLDTRGHKVFGRAAPHACDDPAAL